MASGGVAVSVDVKGLQELQQKLTKLTVREQRPILRKGTRAASTPIRKAIRAAAPVGPTRNLKKSIDRRFKFYRRTGTDVAVIGPTINEAKGYKGFHGWLVEHGTKERTVKDSYGRYKRGLVDRPIPMKVGKMPANPFAERATKAVIHQAGQLGIAAIKRALEAKMKG